MLNPSASAGRSGSCAILFHRKLGYGAPLDDRDRATLNALAAPARRVDRGDIVPEGTRPRSVVLVLDGWVCRYKLMMNGKRQITSLLLPGDLCEPFGALPPLADCSLAAMTPALVVDVPAQALRAAASGSQTLEQALWRDLLLSDALQREHIVSLGRRTATERLGHLFCEVHFRLAMVGLADRFSFEFPLIQADLGDLLGLSGVQVNRSLQELRGIGLLSLRSRQLTIHDLRALQDLSMFDLTALPSPSPAPNHILERS